MHEVSCFPAHFFLLSFFFFPYHFSQAFIMTATNIIEQAITQAIENIDDELRDISLKVKNN